MKILLFLLIAACAPSKPANDQCTEAAIGKLAAECKLRVDRECANIPDSECPAIKECDELIDQRCNQ